MNKILFTLLFGMLSCLSGMSQSDPISKAVVSKEFLFPFQNEHVHGSSLVMLPNGDLLAVWFQGSGERTADDVRIMGSRKKKGSSTWTSPFLMADTKGIPDCNPVLFLNRNNKLFLFWVAVQANQWEYSILRFKTSTHFNRDAAPSWDWQDDILLKPGDVFAQEVKKKFSEMGESHAGWAAFAPKYDDMILEASKVPMKRSFGWMTRIPPVTLSTGRILLPLYSDGLNLSMVAISDDDGDTWRPSLPIVGRGPIQPALAIRKNGDILAYMRDSGDAPPKVWQSVSTDQGESWSLATKTDIPNEASVEIAALKDGRWVYFGNDIDDGRYKLSLYLSDDEGKSWNKKEIIQYDPSKKGSFSYPCLFQSADGLIHISHSWSMGADKKSIQHIVIDPSRIK